MADLFDPRTIMDSDLSISGGNNTRGGGGGGGGGSDGDFGFAFNDSNFSDRVLRIEIMAGMPENKSDVDGCTSIADWARNRKRRREETKKENNDSCWFASSSSSLFSSSLMADARLKTTIELNPSSTLSPESGVVCECTCCSHGSDFALLQTCSRLITVRATTGLIYVHKEFILKDKNHPTASNSRIDSELNTGPLSDVLVDKNHPTTKLLTPLICDEAHPTATSVVVLHM